VSPKKKAVKSDEEKGAEIKTAAKNKAVKSADEKVEVKVTNKKKAVKSAEIKSAEEEVVEIKAAAKEAGAPVVALDGYMKGSVALREKIERLKADVPKRKTEKAALEQRAVELDMRIGMGCPPEMVSKDDFQTAIGTWENKARTLVIEFVDIN